jgi:hypothetical protein
VKRVLFLTAALIASTSASDENPVDAANQFAAAYNAWVVSAKTHQPNELNLGERKAWQRVKDSFRKLDRTLERYGWH